MPVKNLSTQNQPTPTHYKHSSTHTNPTDTSPNMSSSARISTPGAPAVNPLTTANLSEQNRRISGLPTQTDEPEQLAEGLDAVALDSPTEERTEEETAGLALKKRKYSAELFQFHQGMWTTVREDIE